MPKKKDDLRDHTDELMEIAVLNRDIADLKCQRSDSRRRSNELSAQIRAKEKDLAAAVQTASEANLFGDGPLAAKKQGARFG